MGGGSNFSGAIGKGIFNFAGRSGPSNFCMADPGKRVSLISVLRGVSVLGEGSITVGNLDMSRS